MTSWIRDPGVLEAERDDGWVLFHPDTGFFCDLDPIGVEVWSLMAEPVTLAELVDRLTGRFAVDAPTCARDVEAFLRTLAEKRFVTKQD